MVTEFSKTLSDQQVC